MISNQLYGLYDAKADDLDLGSQEMPHFLILKVKKIVTARKNLSPKAA